MHTVLHSVVLVLSFLVYYAQAFGIAGALKEEVKKDRVSDYFVKFGYLNNKFVNADDMTEAIKTFQYFANLPASGMLDSATVNQMDKPRCAMSDPVVAAGGDKKKKIKTKRSIHVAADKQKIRSRQRRWVHQGSQWVTKTKLKWRLVGRGRTLEHETIRGVMKRAFKYWSDVTNLDFIETPSDPEPEIWVKFVRNYHGDPYAFDGEGGTLAHAFYPHNEKGLSGDVHFDDDENFTVNSKYGKNLLWVATHEVGHSIGLEHSNVRNAIMYPWYQPYKPGFKLTYDDINGIQNLYGSRTPGTAPTDPPTEPPTTPTPAPTPAPTAGKPRKACPKGKVTAVYYNSYTNMQQIITDDEKMYMIRDKAGIDIGPMQLRNYIPKSRIPKDIDSVYTTTHIHESNRPMHVIFSGANYYLYQHFSFRGGPYSIHNTQSGSTYNYKLLNLMLPSWVQKVDAAFLWPRNGRTYFFSGEWYWRFNNQGNRMDGGYPRRISDGWRGVPGNVDAGFSHKAYGITYFIKNNQVYKINDKSVLLESGYPKHVGVDWLECGNHVQMQSLGGMMSAPGAMQNLGREP